MANDWLAVQNAYHLVQRNLVNNNNVDVMSGLPATSLSNPALDEETFKQALCVLEKANDALIKNQNSDMIAMSGWEISDPCLHSEFSKVVEKLFTDETHWGGILFYIALTTFLANKLISEGLYQFPVCWLLSLGTTRGGFRNLLLDGWWLEFWEIILLAAGDVERNPGPTFMTENELAVISNTPIGESYLSGVFDEVRPVSSKWYQLCCCLGIPPSRLDAINRTQNGDCDLCLNEGLKEWLRRNYDTEEHGSPTWRKLVAAVDNSAGGNNHVLALAVAENHKIAVRSRDDRKRSEEMSSAFRNMYRSVIQLLQQVDVHEVVDSLRFLTDPASHTELCIPPQLYRRATSTKDLLAKLCPKYVNPRNTFILEDIVANFGSHTCNRLVQEYVDKFM